VRRARTVGLVVGAVLVVVLSGTLIVRVSEVAGLPGRAPPPTSPVTPTASVGAATSAHTGPVPVSVPPITPSTASTSTPPPPPAAPTPIEWTRRPGPRGPGCRR
jgi:hypothetical protein